MSENRFYARADTIALALEAQGRIRVRKAGHDRPGYEYDAHQRRIEILTFLREARAAERHGGATSESVVKEMRAAEAAEGLHVMRIAKYGV